MYSIGKKWGGLVAILVPSVLLAMVHFPQVASGSTEMWILLIAGTLEGIMFSMIAIESETIWSGAFVHSIWSACTSGGFLMIGTHEFLANTTNYLYKYELLSSDKWLTGGQFGVALAQPSVIAYILIIILAFYLFSRKPPLFILIEKDKMIN